eukprot:3645910-Pyramimonas_sp.AAC.1
MPGAARREVPGAWQVHGGVHRRQQAARGARQLVLHRARGFREPRGGGGQGGEQPGARDEERQEEVNTRRGHKRQSVSGRHLFILLLESFLARWTGP